MNLRATPVGVRGVTRLFGLRATPAVSRPRTGWRADAASLPCAFGVSRVASRR
jgi:hypothetical protein